MTRTSEGYGWTLGRCPRCWLGGVRRKSLLVWGPTDHAAHCFWCNYETKVVVK